jgi:hypothetical protein
LNKNPYELSGNTLLKIYCSFENNQTIDHQYFNDISEIFHSANRSYLVGNILLSKLKDLEEKYPNASIISLN